MQQHIHHHFTNHAKSRKIWYQPELVVRDEQQLYAVVCHSESGAQKEKLYMETASLDGDKIQVHFVADKNNNTALYYESENAQRIIDSFGDAILEKMKAKVHRPPSAKLTASDIYKKKAVGVKKYGLYSLHQL